MRGGFNLPQADCFFGGIVWICVRRCVLVLDARSALKIYQADSTSLIVRRKSRGVDVRKVSDVCGGVHHGYACKRK